MTAPEARRGVRNNMSRKKGGNQDFDFYDRPILMTGMTAQGDGSRHSLLECRRMQVTPTALRTHLPLTSFPLEWRRRRSSWPAPPRPAPPRPAAPAHHLTWSHPCTELSCCTLNLVWRRVASVWPWRIVAAVWFRRRGEHYYDTTSKEASSHIFPRSP